MKKVSCEIMSTQEAAYIMGLPSPDGRPAAPAGAVLVPYSSCAYCGQSRTVSGCYSEQEAREAAALHCNCAESRWLRVQKEAERKRAQDLMIAEIKIEDLLGESSGDGVLAAVLDYLKKAAALVYDRDIVVLNTRVSDTTQVVIRRNTKGNLSIERKDTSASKVEV